jgi:ABC-2 type transport system ATP-binding protein
MIKIADLSYSYNGFNSVLRNIDLELEQGHIYGLLGANGVGKTTLIKIMCGLLYSKEECCSVDGINPFKRTIELQRDMFLFDEEPASQNFSIESMAKSLAPLYPNFDWMDFHNMLKELKVDGNVKLKSLSQGQRKKAYIAFGFATNTRYLFMDEPTNGLDITSKETFRKLVVAHALPDRTIIISTHQIDDVDNILDSIIIMNINGVLMSDTIESISSKLYFGPIDNPEEALFVKDTLQGPCGIMKNETNQETTVDLKMLFTAFMEKTDEMTELFSECENSNQ